MEMQFLIFPLQSRLQFFGHLVPTERNVLQKTTDIQTFLRLFSPTLKVINIQKTLYLSADKKVCNNLYIKAVTIKWIDNKE